MQITLYINCPACVRDSIRKNGIKSDGKQNYQCKDCGRQFVGDHALSYRGCHSQKDSKIRQLMIRGSKIRDIACIKKISQGKVLAALGKCNYQSILKQSHYEQLEVDELWTFVGKSG